MTSFVTSILVAGVGFATLVYIVRIILARFNLTKLYMSFAVSHLIAIIILSAIYFPGEKDAQHQFFWMIPYILNLPVSLTYSILSLGNMVYLAISFAFLGTLQYAFIGWLIDIFLSKNKKELIPEKSIIIPIILVICIFSWWGFKNYSFINLPDSEKSKNELNNAINETDRFYALNDAAKSHFESQKFDDARIYATELLNLSKKYKNDWNYGNAVYDSHIVLGRLALLNNDIDKAEEHLFKAVETPGSPQLDSFGPNMTLAKDLLEKGQKNSVIKFLTECKRFWYNHEKVNTWVKEIETGNIPDFGANLVY